MARPSKKREGLDWYAAKSRRRASRAAGSDEPGRAREPGAERVCPNCATILTGQRPDITADVDAKGMFRCPRCGADLQQDRDEDLVDKTVADSFPASDPPSY